VVEKKTQRYSRKNCPRVVRISEEIKDADWPKGKAPQGAGADRQEAEEVCPKGSCGPSLRVYQDKRLMYSSSPSQPIHMWDHVKSSMSYLSWKKVG
jgi:hypothetical protein